MVFRPLGLVCLAAALSVSPAHAGQTTAGTPHTAPDSADGTGASWHFGLDAKVFAGLNIQERKFDDIHELESQNWIMGTATRGAGAGSVELEAMFSLEPFTLRDRGSAQVFQTGETFEGAPIIDFQHPHDLVMQLGGTYTRLLSGTTVRVGADLVGPATLGPTVFMHRPSAAENPQVPLSHHQLDATHISQGVVRTGIERRGVGLEASVFHGREPDEDRVDLDVGPLDSWAVRGTWRRGGWTAQVSGGRLHEPEVFEPFDVTRLTASVSVDQPGISATLAWGQNRELFGNFEAYLFELTWRLPTGSAVYGRAELVDKSILGVGSHPPGFVHPHPRSRVGAFTAGLTQELVVHRWGSVALGGDVTAYRVPDNLEFFYGSPWSGHVFLRYSGPRRHEPAHVH